LIFATTFVTDISHPKKTDRNVIINVQYTGLYEKYGYPLLLSDFNESWISLIDFRKKKFSNMTFYEYVTSSADNQVVLCGRTETDRQTSFNIKVPQFNIFQNKFLTLKPIRSFANFEVLRAVIFNCFLLLCGGRQKTHMKGQHVRIGIH
jgi:hypothetical protein